jgi:vesicle transport through interaction with t-SNAREs protein 1
VVWALTHGRAAHDPTDSKPPDPHPNPDIYRYPTTKAIKLIGGFVTGAARRSDAVEATMSVLPFDRYDDEFAELTSQVRRSLSSIQSDDLESQSSSAESDLNMTANLISQCDDLLKQMSIEARGIEDPQTKGRLLGKARECKSTLSDLKSEFQTENNSFERSMLGLGGGGASGRGGRRGGLRGGLSDESRDRLLRTNDQIADQNATLENARKIMSDTEGTAMEITSELSRNREKIESAHSRVRDVSGLTNRARRIVQSMSRREVQQKLAMYVVSGVLILLVLVILSNMRK